MLNRIEDDWLLISMKESINQSRLKFEKEWNERLVNLDTPPSSSFEDLIRRVIKKAQVKRDCNGKSRI